MLDFGDILLSFMLTLKSLNVLYIVLNLNNFEFLACSSVYLSQVTTNHGKFFKTCVSRPQSDWLLKILLYFFAIEWSFGGDLDDFLLHLV